jgi:hypothetical protein
VWRVRSLSEALRRRCSSGSNLDWPGRIWCRRLKVPTAEAGDPAARAMEEEERMGEAAEAARLQPGQGSEPCLETARLRSYGRNGRSREFPFHSGCKMSSNYFLPAAAAALSTTGARSLGLLIAQCPKAPTLLATSDSGEKSISGAFRYTSDPPRQKDRRLGWESEGAGCRGSERRLRVAIRTADDGLLRPGFPLRSACVRMTALGFQHRGFFRCALLRVREGADVMRSSGRARDCNQRVPGRTSRGFDRPRWG